MKAVRVAPALHEPTRELVNDYHLAVLHDVLAVALENDVSFQRIFDVMHHTEILRRVQVVHVQGAFEPGYAVLGQRDGPVLLVQRVVPLHLERGRDPGVSHVIPRRHLCRTADYQGRARLVNEDVVHLVNDCVRTITLRPR